MTATLVDTSALYAVLDRDDVHHRAATTTWHRLLERYEHEGASLVATSYVLVETSALVQRRLGMDATRALHDQIVPVLDVVWVDPELHATAVTALLAAGRRDISLVDWICFELARQRSITTAFAFDDDFSRQGLLPA